MDEAKRCTWFGIDLDHGTAVFISGATTYDLDPTGHALLRSAGAGQGR